MMNAMLASSGAPLYLWGEVILSKSLGGYENGTRYKLSKSFNPLLMWYWQLYAHAFQHTYIPTGMNSSNKR